MHKNSTQEIEVVFKNILFKIMKNILKQKVELAKFINLFVYNFWAALSLNNYAAVDGIKVTINRNRLQTANRVISPSEMNEYYDIFNSKSPSELTKIPGIQKLLRISKAPAIKLTISRILESSTTQGAGRLTDLRYEHLLEFFYGWLQATIIVARVMMRESY